MSINNEARGLVAGNPFNIHYQPPESNHPLALIFPVNIQTVPCHLPLNQLPRTQPIMQFSTIFALVPAITMAVAAPTKSHGRERRTELLELVETGAKEVLPSNLQVGKRHVEIHSREPQPGIDLPGLSEEELEELEKFLENISIGKRDDA